MKSTFAYHNIGNQSRINLLLHGDLSLVDVYAV